MFKHLTIEELATILAADHFSTREMAEELLRAHLGDQTNRNDAAPTIEQFLEFINRHPRRRLIHRRCQEIYQEQQKEENR
ncbi:MAG: hypothetical protein MPJ24_08055 [Pirellulaceae bacterium]|nr:hypothetical protein [Pirellulaceae bacterium]